MLKLSAFELVCFWNVYAIASLWKYWKINVELEREDSNRIIKCA